MCLSNLTGALVYSHLCLGSAIGSGRTLIVPPPLVTLGGLVEEGAILTAGPSEVLVPETVRSLVIITSTSQAFYVVRDTTSSGWRFTVPASTSSVISLERLSLPPSDLFPLEV